MSDLQKKNETREQELYKDFSEFLKRARPDPYDPTKMLYANDEYYNRHKTFVDGKGKKWTDVTSDIVKF